MRSISIHTNSFQMLLLIKEKEKQRKEGGLLGRRVHDASRSDDAYLQHLRGPSINQTIINNLCTGVTADSITVTPELPKIL